MLRTPLYDTHVALGARLVDFAGWEMPITYSGIKEEHHATRNGCTMFDVSHMGRLYISGPRAAEFLDRLCTRRIDNMEVGQCRYSHVCNPAGGILDDVIVSRLADEYLVVCNASNRDKIVAWFNEHTGVYGVTLTDRTLETAMAAVQGPHAFELLGRLLPINIKDLKRYHCIAGNMLGVKYFIARSGYTGEDGIEVILPATFAKPALEMLIEKTANEPIPIKPAGLGARDTLRLEAGMPLYGHELTEDWDPITAGQKWCCYLDKDFIGVDAICKVADTGPERTIAGFEVDGPRVARDGAAIFIGDEQVGTVTSGTHSPTFDRPIGMGLIRTSVTQPGTAVEFDLRGKRVPGKIVPLPFYKRG